MEWMEKEAQLELGTAMAAVNELTICQTFVKIIQSGWGPVSVKVATTIHRSQRLSPAVRTSCLPQAVSVGKRGGELVDGEVRGLVVKQTQLLVNNNRRVHKSR